MEVSLARIAVVRMKKTASNVRVLNNILVAALETPLNRVNGRYRDVLLSHYLLWGGDGQSVPGEHAVLADPGFADAEGDDFRLGKDSPALHAAGAREKVSLVDLRGGVRSLSDPRPGALEE